MLVEKTRIRVRNSQTDSKSSILTNMTHMSTHQGTARLSRVAPLARRCMTEHASTPYCGLLVAGNAINVPYTFDPGTTRQTKRVCTRLCLSSLWKHVNSSINMVTQERAAIAVMLTRLHRKKSWHKVWIKFDKRYRAWWFEQNLNQGLPIVSR